MHYENNHPFAHVTELEREVEVSHWGNVYFEERYSLVRPGGPRRPAARCSGPCPAVEHAVRMQRLHALLTAVPVSPF